MHVVVAGGGVAGLEALLALSDLAEGLVDVEILSPGDEFVYRPMLVAEPFGAAEVLRIELERVALDTGARHTKDALVSVDPGARTVTTASGNTLGYDALLVALGADAVEAIPGALTFSAEAERRAFAELLSTLGRRRTRRIAFVVPKAVSWSIAAYELALLTAAERDARRLEGVELTLVTHETAPLDLFGAAASQLVAARLAEAGVSLRLSSVAEQFDEGQLHLDGAESLAADAAVALPALVVPPLPGLPQRGRGFVQTDVGMQVVGLETVWAAGDATWFPIKQGGAGSTAGRHCCPLNCCSRRGSRPDPGFPASAAWGADHRRRSRVPSLVTGRRRRGRRFSWRPALVASDQAGGQVPESLHVARSRRRVHARARRPQPLDRPRDG